MGVTWVSMHPADVMSASSGAKAKGLAKQHTAKHGGKSKVMIGVAVNKIRTAVGKVEASTGALPVAAPVSGSLGGHVGEQRAHHSPDKVERHHDGNLLAGSAEFVVMHGWLPGRIGYPRGKSGARRGLVEPRLRKTTRFGPSSRDTSTSSR